MLVRLSYRRWKWAPLGPAWWLTMPEEINRRCNWVPQKLCTAPTCLPASIHLSWRHLQAELRGSLSRESMMPRLLLQSKPEVNSL